MTTSKRFLPAVRIAKFTLLDEMRQRSFIVMCALCIALVLLARGCYQGNYVVNGQALDPATLAGAVSKAAFHIIAVMTIVVAALLSMRVFRSDRDEGTQSCVLSKPITRGQYVLGKASGLWVLSSVFMLILQGILFLIAAITTNVMIPGYVAASLLCCVNLLFVVLVVLLLSLVMPEIMALLSVMGIVVIGLVIDGMNTVASSQVFQAITVAGDGRVHSDLTLGKILYYIWPKVSGMQYFASSLINSDGFHGFWSIYPLFNILVYCLMLGVLLLRRFGKAEIV